MEIRRSLAVGVGVAVLAPLALALPASADLPPDPVVISARAWLVDQQQADGGFELAGFGGFETSDAALALAQASQVDGLWDPATARDAVEDVQTAGGKDALDNIDDLVDGAADPTTVAAGARAAKVAALVAQPLGMDVNDFDPSGNSADDVDLMGRIDLHRQPDGSYDFGAQFNGVLYTAIALAGDGQAVPAGLLAQLRTAQRSDGSWDYTGTTTGDGNDIDTTALALVALRSAGLTTADADVAAGVSWLAGLQQASGAWQAFGSDDPNSTALATVALSDLHIDVSTAGWRTTFGAPVAGTYTSPLAWLDAQQAADGHIASPNDSFGVTTFATSQALQARSQQWYLQDEKAGLLDAWSKDLASPAAAPAGGRLVNIGSDALGPNPSRKDGRLAATTAALASKPGREAAAADLFQLAFGRTIDPSGRAYWSNQLITQSRPAVLARLTGSSEFSRRAGGTTEGFVTKVYEVVLDRAPDPSGQAYWVRKLQQGTSVQAVARSLTASAEHRRLQVDGAYARVLDRAPSASERTYWSAKLATTRVEVLLAALGATAEYYEALEA